MPKNLKKINNPHDLLFKKIMNVSANGERFLMDHLPEDIVSLLKPKGLSIVEGTFIDEDLRETRSDLLYNVELKGKGKCYIYVLMEHKSYPDSNVPLQLLGYMVRIWEKHRREHEKGNLPNIVPFVFYHGRSKWPYEPFFTSINGNLLSDTNFLPLNFKYILHDLSQISDEEIKGTILLKVVQNVFKYIHQPKKLFEKMEILLNLLQKETVSQYIEALLRYVHEQTDDSYHEKLTNIAERTVSNGGKIMGTIAQELRNEGRIEGHIEGRIEGLLEGKFGSAGLALMNRIRGISDSDKLVQIIDFIKKAKTIDDLKEIGN